ncbi:MAG: twin-arginine translocation signal domain-containing protein, partial [Candidatus Rokubacteria bacterium]|nr:twin-arginine translocation signal domain-containing protein [Candidatus Rokubacteria bacterium]
MTTEPELPTPCRAWYLDRRDFLKTGAFLGGSAALAAQLERVMGPLGTAEAQGADAYPLAKPENILYSACQQCNTGCGIKAKIVDGVVVKIDGNPFDPLNLT